VRNDELSVGVAIEFKAGGRDIGAMGV